MIPLISRLMAWSMALDFFLLPGQPPHGVLPGGKGGSGSSSQLPSFFVLFVKGKTMWKILKIGSESQFSKGTTWYTHRQCRCRMNRHPGLIPKWRQPLEKQDVRSRSRCVVARCAWRRDQEKEKHFLRGFPSSDSTMRPQLSATST